MSRFTVWLFVYTKKDGGEMPFVLFCFLSELNYKVPCKCSISTCTCMKI